jgi:hypothetical protein
MCAGAISFARIRRLYYGAEDPKGGGVDNGVRFLRQPTCHHAPDVYSGINEVQAAEIAAGVLSGEAGLGRGLPLLRFCMGVSANGLWRPWAVQAPSSALWAFSPRGEGEFVAASSRVPSRPNGEKVPRQSDLPPLRGTMSVRTIGVLFALRCRRVKGAASRPYCSRFHHCLPEPATAASFFFFFIFFSSGSPRSSSFEGSSTWRNSVGGSEMERR